jgi:hypothetical protein
MDDFCSEINNEQAPWFIFTGLMKQRTCPFPDGHIEHFENEPITGSELPEYYTLTLVGKYRVTFVSEFIDDDDKVHEECSKISFEIVPK